MSKTIAFAEKAASVADPKVLCFTDTFGKTTNNGVGRFLEDLLQYSEEHGRPLHLVAPGKGEVSERIFSIRAPAFTLPVYSKVGLSFPLEVHRRSLRRFIRELKPDLIHVSTPGPFGCLGLSVAREYQIPVLGLVHTDFPKYARILISQNWNSITQQMRSRGMLWLVQLLGRVQPFLEKMEQINPDFEEDVNTVVELVKKQFTLASKNQELSEVASNLGEQIVSQILRNFYSRFTMIIARSTYHEHQLSAQLKISPLNIRALSPGTDTTRFNPSYRDRTVFQRMGLKKESFVVLAVGRLTAEKNVGLLWAAWRELQRQVDLAAADMHLIVAGYGDAKTVTGSSELVNCHFVGPKQGRELSELYASADVLLFPSVTETLGQVGLEAAASGIPVLAASVGGQTSYIRDGQDGFILSPERVEDWVSRLQFLYEHRSVGEEMGRNARQQVEKRYRIEHSMESYWRIHREAHAFAQIEANLEKKATQVTSVPVTQPSPTTKGLLLISDYHAGRHAGLDGGRVVKHEALEAMFSLAVEEDLELILGGDFGDHGSNPAKLAADFEEFRKIKERWLPDHEPVFIRGNHDYGYTDKQLQDFVGGCRVHSSLVYFHESARVLLTHGHVLGLMRVIDIALKGGTTSQIEQQLTEKQLDQDLKPSIIAYDVANLMESSLEPMGLSGLNLFWEKLFKYRADLAEKLFALASQAKDVDQRSWKLMASLLGSRDDLQSANQLGTSFGSWATIFGHTHEPLAERITNSDDSMAANIQIIGNAGNMNRDNPTCVVARFPTVTVHVFNPRTGRLEPQTPASLTEAESLRYSSKFMFGSRVTCG